MSNNLTILNNGSDCIKSLAQMVQSTQEMMLPLQHSIATYKEAIKPLVEMATQVQALLLPMAGMVSQIRHKLEALSVQAKETSRIYSCINRLAENQYVYWDYLTDDFINDILKTNNVNKTLRALLVKDKWKKVYSTIEKCMANPFLKKRIHLYTQSVNAFKHGDYDLSVNGFTSVIDGLLSDVSGKTTHQLKPRIDSILKKLDSDAALDEEEYAMVILTMTLEKTLELFSNNAPFDKAEPKGLNRHWIAHGRSTRKKTKLDCVKLINLIYAILLIDELN